MYKPHLTDLVGEFMLEESVRRKKKWFMSTFADFRSLERTQSRFKNKKRIQKCEILQF